MLLSFFKQTADGLLSRVLVFEFSRSQDAWEDRYRIASSIYSSTTLWVIEWNTLWGMEEGSRKRSIEEIPTYWVLACLSLKAEICFCDRLYYTWYQEVLPILTLIDEPREWTQSENKKYKIMFYFFKVIWVACTFKIPHCLYLITLRNNM